MGAVEIARGVRPSPCRRKGKAIRAHVGKGDDSLDAEGRSPRTFFPIAAETSSAGGSAFRAQRSGMSQSATGAGRVRLPQARAREALPPIRRRPRWVWRRRRRRTGRKGDGSRSSDADCDRVGPQACVRCPRPGGVTIGAARGCGSPLRDGSIAGERELSDEDAPDFESSGSRLLAAPELEHPQGSSVRANASP